MLLNYKNLKLTDFSELYDKYCLNLTSMNDRLSQLDNTVVSWETFIAPQLEFANSSALELQILAMDDFHPNKEIRDVCNDISTKFSKFGIDQNMRRDVFEKFKYYYENTYQTEKESMSSERMKFVEDSWKSYLMNGLNLDEENFNKVKEIKKELAELSNKFSFNLTNVTTSFEFSLAQLEGMPENWLQSRVLENSNYNVTLKYPDYLPLMEYCKIRETRKTIATAFNSRCKDENSQIAERVFKLRHELALIFGHDSYANYSLQKKMAKNKDNVMKFLSDLNNSLVPVLESDYKKLGDLALADGIDKLQLYDMAYYTRLYKESETQLDNESVREYFGFDDVTNGVFNIYQQFLSVKFTDVTAEHLDELWHETVQLFQVNDEKTGRLMGYFYLDTIPRDGKYGHAAVFPFVRKSSATLPVCTMACNFPRDSGLNHSEVVTYFHEFGHVMHNICSDVELIAHGGTSVERDFVETPSQLFENWCFDMNALSILSGNKITQDIVDKINKQEKLFQGYHYSRQLLFAISDMLIHSSRWQENPNEVYSSVMKEILKFDPLEGTNFIATFSHILCGYEAGYYGYLWSEVFSADLYYTCVKGHELDPEVGALIRKEILSYGGSRDSSVGLFNMLGREPSNEGFIKSIFG